MEKNDDIKRIYHEYYRLKRTAKFLRLLDRQAAWLRLEERTVKKRARRRILGMGLAASILVLLGAGIYFFLVPEGRQQFRPYVVYPELSGYRAVLSLGDGKVVDLSRETGRLNDTVSSVEISNAEGHLEYQVEEGDVPEEEVVASNTLYVPRGGEYRLRLADGTGVWLNADTRLKFPERFGKVREIYMEGEAYFEVAKDSVRPFIVHVGNSTVEVLGTHFNVYAYEGEPMATTLVEGRVRVGNDSLQVVLSPGQQAIVSSGDIDVRVVDAERYVSWAQGKYIFQNMSLKNILLQLERWYDVEFCYEDLPDRRIAGVIYRQESLGFALRVLERVAGVRFIRSDGVIHVREALK